MQELEHKIIMDFNTDIEELDECLSDLLEEYDNSEYCSFKIFFEQEYYGSQLREYQERLKNIEYRIERDIEYLECLNKEKAKRKNSLYLSILGSFLDMEALELIRNYN